MINVTQKESDPNYSRTTKFHASPVAQMINILDHQIPFFFMLRTQDQTILLSTLMLIYVLKFE